MNYDELFLNKDLNIKNDLVDILSYLKKKEGWIYISKSKDNGFLKIGRTSKNPWVRAKTLSTSGVFNSYEVLFSLKVFNQILLEKKVHKLLKKYRISTSKEFFSVDFEYAKNVISKEVEIEEESLKIYFNISMLREDLNLINEAYIKK